MKEDPSKYETASARDPLADRIRYTWQSLRMKFRRQPILVAGPYVGEFGHEIMDWQSYVRALRPRYREVHVITYPGHEALYPGCIVHPHNIRLENAGYFYGAMPSREIEALARRMAGELGLGSYDLFHTGHLCSRIHRKWLWRQAHEPFRPGTPPGQPVDVLFHFRQVRKAGPDTTKNYDPARAGTLWTLCRDSGLSCACIGHPRYAYCPPGCADLRSETVAGTIASIGSCRIVAGECSGPIHLAMYCGKPVVIWASHWWGPAAARCRNPFRVALRLISDQTTQVDPADVHKAILEELRPPSAGSIAAARGPAGETEE